MSLKMLSAHTRQCTLTRRFRTHVRVYTHTTCSTHTRQCTLTRRSRINMCLSYCLPILLMINNYELVTCKWSLYFALNILNTIHLDLSQYT